MRLYRGRTPSLRRRLATLSSLVPARVARRASEKPMALSACRFAASFGRPRLRILPSISTISASWSMNQGSYLQAACTRSLDAPCRKASATLRMRSGVGRPRAARTAFLSSPSPRPGMAISSRPVRSVSRLRSAFCKDSGKVRPMAMTSPTDFMAVVSTGSAPGNFSKAKRGILVTT